MSMWRQSYRFGAVGVFNSAVGLVAIYSFMAFGAHPGVANAMGYAVGMCFSFALNRAWTFGSRAPVASQLPRFAGVIALSYLLNLVAVLSLIAHGGVDPFVAQLAGMTTYTVCSFVGCRRFVFGVNEHVTMPPRPAQPQ